MVVRVRGLAGRAGSAQMLIQNILQLLPSPREPLLNFHLKEIFVVDQMKA
jgi:hypothetical protein